MASFTKVCIDWSNNLRNFWTPRPSSTSSSPQLQPSPTVSPNKNRQSQFTNHRSTERDMSRDNTQERNRTAGHVTAKMTDRSTSLPSPIPSRRCKLNGNTNKTIETLPAVADYIHRGMSTENHIDQRHPQPSGSESLILINKEPITTWPISKSPFNMVSPNNGIKNPYESNVASGISSSTKAPVFAMHRSTMHVIDHERERNPIKLSPSSPTVAHRIAQLTRSFHLNAHREANGSSAKNTIGVDYYHCNSAGSSPIFPHRGITVAAIKQKLLSQGMKMDVSTPVSKHKSVRFRNYVCRVVRGRPAVVSGLWRDEKVMEEILKHLSGTQLLHVCVVCKCWFRISCNHGFWGKLAMKLDFSHKRFRSSVQKEVRKMYEDNTPKSFTTQDELDGEMRERLASGVRRQIQSLSITRLADCYVPALYNALAELRQNASYPANVNNVMTATSPCHRFSRKQSSIQRSITMHAHDTPTCKSHTKAQPDVYRRVNACSQCTRSSYIPLSSTLLHADAPSNYGQGQVRCEKSGSESRLSSKNQDTFHFHKLHRKSKFFTHLALRFCPITDNSLQLIVHTFPGLYSLHLECCNRLTAAAFWNCLPYTIVNLSILDCINVTDDSVSAVAQLLPNLKHFTLQAYHVTDSAFIYFRQSKRTKMKTVKLTQCMVLTCQGVENLSFALPQLHTLSISGCANVLDEGLGALCRHFQQLVELDLSWCSKITDDALKCIASEQVGLKKLVLDRCVALTDFGIGYLSTLARLEHLSLRWCSKLSDGIAPHVLSMISLTYLSLAGCKRITEEGLYTLIQHPSLKRLELTHCPAANGRLMKNLKEISCGFCVWN
ncbi:unnamed protein product [Dicrocoelium dendriticum]|nr:unnamed protein product [Dicrocoelium dendriticum]